jgi:hypothetical protein
MSLAPHLASFFSVCLNELLYHYEIYPKQLFARKFSLFVSYWSARHPAVQEYISSLVEQLVSILQAEDTISIRITIKDKKTNSIHVTYVFVKTSVGIISPSTLELRNLFLEFQLKVVEDVISGSWTLQVSLETAWHSSPTNEQAAQNAKFIADLCMGNTVKLCIFVAK